MDRIDIHAHGFPEAYLRKLAEAYPDDVVLRRADDADALIAYWSRAPLPAWSLQRRLREMDADDVGVEVLSAPSVYSKLDGRTAEFCRLLNDFQAEAGEQAPGRFRSFIHLPVHDLEATRAELARWRGHPSVAGVLLGSNMDGLYPGDPSLSPVWEQIHAAGLPVFVHPLGPPCTSSPIMQPILHFPTDTGVAAASMIYAGLFERFADLRIILSHYGGPLPQLARRLDMAVENKGFPAGHGQDLPQAPSRYLERFFVDTAQGYHRPGFDCACAVFGIRNMLYGSDHFLLGSRWRAELNAFLDELPISASERRAILRDNAERVLA